MKKILIILLLILSACDEIPPPKRSAQWNTDFIPAKLDHLSINGLILQEELEIIDGQPTLLLHLSVTQEIEVGGLTAVYSYLDIIEGSIEGDVQSDLEAQADQLLETSWQDGITVDINGVYAPAPGEAETRISTYSLPLGNPSEGQVIAYYTQIRVNRPQGTLGDGKLLLIDGTRVHTSMD